MIDIIQQIDSHLLYFIHDILQFDILDKTMPMITSLGNGGTFWILVALILLLRRDTRKSGIAMALSMLLCYLFGNIWLKNFIARPRPYTVDPAITLLIPPSSEPFSFPSGHTMNAFSASFALMLREERFWRAAILIAELIAFSRIYLMMHYPLDIVGGIVVAYAAAYIVNCCITYFENR